jgi:hypothetical protein
MNAGEFTAGGEHYRIRIANTRKLRERSYRLMHDIYRRTGYARPHSFPAWYSLFELLPDSVTLVVMRGSDMVGTMSVVFDSPFGLPDDETYGAELDALRASGMKLSQIISFGAGKLRRGSREVLGRLFDCAYLTARRIRRATHFVHTVIPRHAHFYRDHLLFDRAGPERFQPKTGVSVVLLSIPLDTPDWVEGELRERTFYRFFLPENEEHGLVAGLRGQVAAPSVDEIDYFLSRRPEVWKKASAEQRTYFEIVTGYRSPESEEVTNVPDRMPSAVFQV